MSELAGGLVFAPFRAQGGREREAIRVFPDLEPDHPAVGYSCFCGQPLDAGQPTAIAPLGPADSPDAREKASAGRWYTCQGLLSHAACVLGVYPDLHADQGAEAPSPAL